MPILRMNYFSHVLELTTTCSIILPQKLNAEPVPVLYLLHGYSDNDEAWLLNSRIAKLVEELNLAVVMPHGYNGYYTDSVSGFKIYSYLTKELFPYLDQLFHFSQKPAERYLAGLSMGGYGAFKLGLRQKNRYGKVYSLSGALDIGALYEEGFKRVQQFLPLFGDKDDFLNSENNLLKLVTEQADQDVTTEFIMTCGRQDFLFENNNGFYAATQALLPLRYCVFDGAHDWAFWDSQIEQIVNEIKKDQDNG